MHQVVRINLDNEMDLILAHKRTMKLAELCGFSVSSQTTFATAVSEIARCAISFGQNAYMMLGINFLRANKKEITALLINRIDLNKVNSDALTYATKLMGDLNSSVTEEGLYEITLKHPIPFSGTITDAKIAGFINYFKNEPPLSPYDEIRKKNIQLIDLADKLRQSENTYRVLTDTLPLMMFAINRKGEITYSNKGLKDFLGVSSTQVTSILWQSMVHPEDYQKLWKDWDKSMVEYTIFRGQGRLKDKEKDKYIWHLISIVPVKNDKNVVTTWIGFFVDIQAQKLIEETLKDNKELKEAKKELEMYQYQLEHKIKELNISNHDLEQFAYIASHDLQEPLRKIKTFSQILKKDLTLEEREERFFDKIISSADRMSNLISDVLNYSRLTNSNEPFKLTDLNIVLENVKADFELLLQEKQVELNNTQLPVVYGIPLHLTQLFSNLLSNSIKFSENKPVITISSRLLTDEESNNITQLSHFKKYYEIRFHDNGIGFEQKYANQIFTIFQRLNDRYSYPGTGIGLALCKKIVENHMGIILAESEPNKGATFLIYLPAII